MESQKYLNDDGNMDFFSLRGVVGRRRRIKIGKKGKGTFCFGKYGTGRDGTEYIWYQRVNLGGYCQRRRRRRKGCE